MPVAIRPKGHNQLDFFLTTAILPQTCDVLLSAYAQSWKVARRREPMSTSSLSKGSHPFGLAS